MPVNSITLSELNLRIKNVIKNSFDEAYWIVAEINELRINQSGHCYIELIEKQENSDNIIAKNRANIWVQTYRILQPYFETTTGTSLKAGLKVLIYITVEFHELYGFSLRVIDIDPTYTLGDLAKQRQEIIERLEKEGIINMNKELELPLVIQRIAVISSETAAGYGDFANQLLDNQYDYKYYIKLFHAKMQGDKAVQTIIDALDKIYKYEDFFDIVVIIRGGGSKTDLSCFDNYSLANNIAQFPLPVITGIGHERDDTIADIVANTKLKTPTAVAEYIILNTEDFENYLINLNDVFVDNINELLKIKKTELNNLSYRLVNNTSKTIIETNNLLQNKKILLKTLLPNYYLSKKNTLDKNKKLITFYSVKFINNEKHRIEMFDKIIEYSDPLKALSKGYSLTKHNGKIIKSIKQLKNDDIIESIIADGTIQSKVKKIVTVHKVNK